MAWLQTAAVDRFPETRDNWDMDFVQFQLIVPGSFPQVIAQAGLHRFTGDSAVLDVPVLPPS